MRRVHYVDGLHTVCWLPARAPRIVLVARTPYDATQYDAEGRGWNEHGIGLVVQDVRGRYGSPGSFRPYLGEAEDGLDLLAWVRCRPWASGPVVLYGNSYGAHCAVETAIAGDGGGPDGPDGMVLAVPALGLGETARTPGGVFQLESRLGWWTQHAGSPAARQDLNGLPGLCSRLPVAELGRHADARLPQWDRVVTSERRDLERRRAIARLRAPLLMIGGTADWFGRDAVDLWSSWGGPAHLVLGPWDHGLRGAGRARRILDWLDRTPGGSAGPTWQSAEVVDSDGHSTRMRQWPTRQRLVVLPGGRFHADPDDPHPSPAIGSPSLAPDPRSDRLVIGLPSSRSAGPLIGDVLVRLRHDQPSTSLWCLTLARRAAEGELVEIAHTSGVGALHRLGPIAVGASVTGHISLVVSAHSFPRYARDLQTGQAPMAGRTTRSATRTVTSIEMEIPA